MIWSLSGDNSPARLRFPGGCGQRCAENLGAARTWERARIRLLAWQIGRKELGEICRVEIGEAVRRHLNRAFGLGQNARRLLSERAFVLADIWSVGGNIHQTDDMRVDAGLGDDRAAIAMTDEKRGPV